MPPLEVKLTPGAACQKACDSAATKATVHAAPASAVSAAQAACRCSNPHRQPSASMDEAAHMLVCMLAAPSPAHGHDNLAAACMASCINTHKQRSCWNNIPAACPVLTFLMAGHTGQSTQRFSTPKVPVLNNCGQAAFTCPLPQHLCLHHGIPRPRSCRSPETACLQC